MHDPNNVGGHAQCSSAVSTIQNAKVNRSNRQTDPMIVNVESHSSAQLHVAITNLDRNRGTSVRDHNHSVWNEVPESIFLDQLVIANQIPGQNSDDDDDELFGYQCTAKGKAAGWSS